MDRRLGSDKGGLGLDIVIARLTDFGVKRLSFSDFSRISEMPCVRSSLLSGIASGVGVGIIRGVSARKSVHRLVTASRTDIYDPGPFVASNWAMSTFLVISTGSWYGPPYARPLPGALINPVQ